MSTGSISPLLRSEHFFHYEIDISMQLSFTKDACLVHAVDRDIIGECSLWLVVAHCSSEMKLVSEVCLSSKSYVRF